MTYALPMPAEREAIEIIDNQKKRAASIIHAKSNWRLPELGGGRSFQMNLNDKGLQGTLTCRVNTEHHTKRL